MLHVKVGSVRELITLPYYHINSEQNGIETGIYVCNSFIIKCFQLIQQ